MTQVAQSASFVRAHDIEIEVLDKGITRQILGFGPDIMTCRLWFDAGAIGSVHSHPHSQTTYVESGTFRSQIGEEFVELGAGDSVYIAPHQVHGTNCVTAGSLLDCFSPMRADFLEGKTPK